MLCFFLGTYRCIGLIIRNALLTCMQGVEMASFSSIGVGLGGSVDVNGLIKASVDAVKLPSPANGLNDQAKFTEAKISTFGKLQSLVSSLQSAAGKLRQCDWLECVSASSSNDKAVSATAIGGTVETTFSVEVSALAKAQVATSDALTSNAAVGAGSLKMRWGGGVVAASRRALVRRRILRSVRPTPWLILPGRSMARMQV